MNMQATGSNPCVPPSELPGHIPFLWVILDGNPRIQKTVLVDYGVTFTSNCGSIPIASAVDLYCKILKKTMNRYE